MAAPTKPAKPAAPRTLTEAPHFWVEKDGITECRDCGTRALASLVCPTPRDRAAATPAPVAGGSDDPPQHPKREEEGE